MNELEESFGINLNSGETSLTTSTVTELSRIPAQMSEEKMKYYNSYNSDDRDNSSDDDRPANVEVVAADDNDETDVATNEYEMLTDDFGEFVSSEDFVDENSFADFSEPIGLFRNNKSNQVTDENEEQTIDNQPTITAPVRPAIAPLSKGLNGIELVDFTDPLLLFHLHSIFRKSRHNQGCHVTHQDRKPQRRSRFK